MSQLLRLAVVADFPEERWESMDLVAEMILSSLNQRPDLKIQANVITPDYCRLVEKVFGKKRWAWNIDRLMNRRVVLRHGLLRKLRKHSFDAIFVVDHSYAHVICTMKNRYPAIPVVVMCHDLDAFQALDQPVKGLYGWLMRWFSKPVFNGLVKADWIITGSETVHQQMIEKYKHQIDPQRVSTNPYGMANEFESSAENAASMASEIGFPVVLHVGSVIPRKRIDVLLRAVSELSKRYPDLTLLRVGGEFTPLQKMMVDELGLKDRIRVMPRLSRDAVAACYRLADVVLITSEAEGFGLPVVEALSCGAAVVASDIAVLRETGGEYVSYAAVGDSAEFARQATERIEQSRGGQGRIDPPGLKAHLEQFRWSTHVERLASVLQGLVCKVP